MRKVPVQSRSYGDVRQLSTARISPQPQPPAAEQRSVIGGRRRETVRLLATVDTVETVETVETHNTVHRYIGAPARAELIKQ